MKKLTVEEASNLKIRLQENVHFERTASNKIRILPKRQQVRNGAEFIIRRHKEHAPSPMKIKRMMESLQKAEEMMSKVVEGTGYEKSNLEKLLARAVR